MIWAQWGLKDRLVADPDIWLCHQCNDCSTKCPRGARPGDVLAALRHQHVRHYAFPKFFSTWANQVKYLPLMLLIPGILLALALVGGERLGQMLPFEEHHGFYAGFFAHWLLIGFFSAFTGLAFLTAVSGLVRFWRAMKAADAASGTNAPVRGMVSSVIRAVRSIFTHDKFGQCTSQSSRRLAHLLAFYGFLALFVVTIWAVIDIYVNPLLGIESLYPFGLLHPMKILANVGCVILIVGCVKAIYDRMGNKAESGVSQAFDWIFVWLLLSVAVSGLLTEVFRFVAEPAEHAAGSRGLRYAAFAVYFVHLVLVFDLLVYLPYSKFAHLLYRTAALVYAERSGRNGGDVQSA
jgi:quinone-modifying oxidoreductase subunit QmoC